MIKKLLIGIVLSLLLLVSPLAITYFIAQQDGHVHKYSVTINSPQEEVWHYLSDNKNAHKWSIFFDHITTLESDDPTISEGGIGSIRRCFRNPDETGITWDEVTVNTKPYEFRQIHTYNVQHWPYKDFNELEFNVYQTYEDLGNGKTKLSFATDLKTPMTAYAKWMFYLAKWETERIFQANMENIKAHIEQGQLENYQRPHLWEEENPLEPILKSISH